MSNPNIVNVTDIRGKTLVANLTSINSLLVVENPPASNKVFKINTLIISNTSGNVANVTINLFDTANVLTGNSTELISTVVVPAEASLVAISKDTSIYLEEDKSIGAKAGIANTLKVVCSYEEIS